MLPTSLSQLPRAVRLRAADLVLVEQLGAFQAASPAQLRDELTPTGGDDAAMVQEALDETHAAGGGVLALGAGEWVLGTTLDVGTRTRLVGRGPGATLLRTTSATAPTVRVWGSGFAGVGGWAVGSVVTDLAFNPADGVSRDDDAPEVDVQFAVGCSLTRLYFGDPTHDPAGSNVGTMVRFGDRDGSYSPATGGDPPWAACYVSDLTSTCCHRALDLARGIDVSVARVIVACCRQDAQGVRIGAGTEAVTMVGCDIINGAADPTGEAMLIEDGARFCLFSSMYLDSFRKALRMTGGAGHQFANCWFEVDPDATSRTLDIGSGASSVRIANSIVLYGQSQIDGADINLVDSVVGSPNATAIALGATARDFYLRGLAIDNDPFPGRADAGSLSATTATGLSIDAAATGRWRDIRYRRAGGTSWLTDGDQ